MYDTQSELDRMCRGIREDLVKLATRINSDDFDGTYTDDDGDEMDALDMFLEVVNERGRNFALVSCVGGPHIETEWVNGYATVEGYWGGDRVSLPLDRETANTLNDYFFPDY